MHNTARQDKSKDNLMQDPDILDKNDFEIENMRNAKVVNSNQRPFMTKNQRMASSLLEDSEALKKVLRQSGNMIHHVSSSIPHIEETR
jgi:hypothetical protein